MRILIIDSDNSRLETISEQSKSRGHQVVGVTGLGELSQDDSANPFDAIFAGSTDGSWDVLTLLRTRPESANSIIIALTTPEKAEAALTAGADDYTSAPFSEKNTIALQLFVIEERLRKHKGRTLNETSNNPMWRALESQSQTGALIIDQKGCVQSHNELATLLLANSENKIEGTHLSDLIETETKTSENSLEAFLSGKARNFKVEAQSSSASEKKLLCLELSPIEGAVDGAFGLALVRDLSAQQELEKIIQHNNLYDPLTGLPNRELLVDRISHVMNRNKRQPEENFGVLFVDVDRFKNLNDSVGRVQGDQLLIELSKRLARSLRPGDTVARIGGDEFTILLENIKSVADATRVSERIREELIEPTNIDGQEVIMSVSIGIVTSESGYEDPEELLRDADTAMHRAKSLGKGRHHIFDREMHNRVTNLLSLEQDLRRALDRQEFWVAYQPIINLKTGKIHGVEALLRWNHSERGFISPGDFIPLAEECGVILSLGQWVLGESCKQAQGWHNQFNENPPLHLSVNVSSKQFADPKLVKKVQNLLKESQLNPEALSLEITESVVMEKSDEATDALANLQNLGIRLHMDDFGTGYSSLAYLHRFPMDALKIDRSFIMRMDQGDRTIELVRTIINLARTQRLSVVAEGVETQKHLDTLRALGCDYAQGYFFSKPLNAEAITELLASDPKW